MVRMMKIARTESPPPVLTPFLANEILEAKWTEIGQILDGTIKVKTEMAQFLHEHIDQCMQQFHEWLLSSGSNHGDDGDDHVADDDNQ